MSNKIYEMVTNKIIEKLEAGIIPWKQPWKNGGAVNWVTQKHYRGINRLMLADGEYATFKQVRAAGGKVKKGAKASIVVFWKWIEVEQDGEIEKIPFLKYSNVFDISTQVEGLKSKRKIVEYDHDPIEEAAKIVEGYPNAPRILQDRQGAWYKPEIDLVNVPPLKDFEKPEEYYSVLFHELIHSTGHKDRLNRSELVGTHKFGSKEYSKEELTAEMGASMLCGVAGIENQTIDNSVAYLQSWIKQLKNDKTLIIKAAGKAQKASDHIMGIKYEG